MLSLPVELLPLGLLLLVMVPVQAPVVEPDLVSEPYLELVPQSVPDLVPQSVPVLGSELEWVP